MLTNSKVAVAVLVNQSNPSATAQPESTKLGAMVLNDLGATIRTNSP